MNADLDHYFEEQKIRKEELNRLRSIVLKADLKEELKWNAPCYTYQNKNVCMIFNFKNSFGISFFKGSFIHDSYEILEKPGDNTQNVRMIKLSEIKELDKKENAISNYINQAIELEKIGVKIVKTTEAKFECIEELEIAFAKNPKLKVAF